MNKKILILLLILGGILISGCVEERVNIQEKTKPLPPSIENFTIPDEKLPTGWSTNNVEVNKSYPGQGYGKRGEESVTQYISPDKDSSFQFNGWYW